ncbi:MAG: hypothetical protein RLZZ347_527 [Candidatus Parcubacteria bacterium]|jgi:hypothetical protein
MQLVTDSHFLIGHAHHTAGKPCQDYALGGVQGNIAYAVVADGCSTGGLTDVGSRTIALTTTRALKGLSRLPGVFGPGQVSLVRGDGIRQASMILGLNPHDMLATCIYAHLSSASNSGFVHLEGDGVVAMKLRSGDIEIFRYDWADNTPFYPSYMDNPNGFIQAHGNDLTAHRLTRQHLLAKADGTFQQFTDEQIPLGRGIQGVTIPIEPPNFANIEFVAIFTDGVTQVENVDWKTAVVDLLAFKTTEGEFAKRRMNRMVKDAQKKGHGPIDDISFSVIKLNQEG